jgi:hypothetical protein
MGAACAGLAAGLGCCMEGLGWRGRGKRGCGRRLGRRFRAANRFGLLSEIAVGDRSYKVGGGGRRGPASHWQDASGTRLSGRASVACRGLPKFLAHKSGDLTSSCAIGAIVTFATTWGCGRRGSSLLDEPTVALARSSGCWTRARALLSRGRVPASHCWTSQQWHPLSHCWTSQQWHAFNRFALHACTMLTRRGEWHPRMAAAKRADPSEETSG